MSGTRRLRLKFGKKRIKVLQQLATILETTPDLVAMTDMEGRLAYLNPSGKELLGLTEARSPALSMLECFAAPSAELIRTQAIPIARQRQVWVGETEILSHDGRKVPVSQVILHHRQGSGEYLSTIARDISQYKDYEKKIAKMAYHDPLTDLPNRRYLEEQAMKMVALARRKNWEMAVLYIDLDGFKAVNDSCGHKVGDEVLKVIAKRLQDSTRMGDFVARLGGDEFVLVVNDASREQVKQVAERVLDILTRPLSLSGQKLELGGSIGLACFPGDGETLEVLLRNADLAMYEAKREGKGIFAYSTTA